MPNAVAILEPGYAAYDTERAILDGLDVELSPVSEEDDAPTSLKNLDPVAVLTRERIVGEAEISACPRLKLIMRYGVGTDNIDLDLARERGVYVANVPDYGAEIEVSEHAVALYLAVQRRVLTRDAQVRQGRWGLGQSAMIPSRHGAALGLIGCGRIGIATAEKFRALGFGAVRAYDPFLGAETARAHRIESTDLETLAATCDVVSLHAPLTPETRHILSRTLIARLRPSAIVINVSRGGLVDDSALAEALNAGRIFGAGVDVFEVEPIAEDNPLLSAPNTVLSDHTAWYSERSVSVLQRQAALEVRRVLEGDPPNSWVNRW